MNHLKKFEVWENNKVLEARNSYYDNDYDYGDYHGKPYSVAKGLSKKSNLPNYAEKTNDKPDFIGTNMNMYDASDFLIDSYGKNLGLPIHFKTGNASKFRELVKEKASQRNLKVSELYGVSIYASNPTGTINTIMEKIDLELNNGADIIIIPVSEEERYYRDMKIGILIDKAKNTDKLLVMVNKYDPGSKFINICGDKNSIHITSIKNVI